MNTRKETVAFLLGGAAAAAMTMAGLTLGLGALSAAMVGVAALAGLPHGALDPLVARDRGLWRTTPGLLVFSGVYVALAAVVVGVWMLSPVLSLAAFLLASAWHFGDDGRDPGTLARFAIGGLIVCVPALAHPQQTIEIYQIIGGAGAGKLVTAQAWLAPLCLIGSGVAVASRVRVNLWLSIEIAATALFAVLLPPLIFFSVYFCLLHSPRHIRSVYGAVRHVPAGITADYAIGLSALVLAAAAFGFVWLLPSVLAIEQAILPVVFVGLAALTAPHMLLIDARPERVLSQRSRSALPTGVPNGLH